MLIIFIIYIYYSRSRLFNCTTLNMYAYHAHNTHCTTLALHFQVICNQILVTHATIRPWGLIHG
jgi:hypothetical protein